MAVRSWSSLLTAIQLDSNSNSNSSNNGIPPKKQSLPHLSLNKPSWLVRTESNVRKEVRKKPDPPCVVCQGSGRVDCHHCCGTGRTNRVHLAMLPRGEWPKWCRTCSGSGLSYCSRCLGTGEYRYIMGFHFMKMDSDHTREHNICQTQGNSGPQSAADRLLDAEPSSSNHEI